MSDKRFLGNIITPTPTAPSGPFQDGAAPGVWSLQEAFTYTKAGLWPTAGVIQRGVFAGGRLADNSSTNTIDQVDITTAGNATDFGDLTAGRLRLASASSSTRGVWAGGNIAGLTNIIDYVTIASAGNAVDFGDLSTANEELAACSNNTRMLIAGGNNGTQINTIEYVTIASVGNVTDFGDLTQPTIASGKINTLAALANSTRGVMLGGFNGALGGQTNAIQYVTIASTGNALDFGDLLAARSSNTACSDSTRGITWGGDRNVIEYITIASTGNSVDFGDTSITFGLAGSASGLTRGLIGGGDSGGRLNTVEFVTIQTTGNSTDFGDLTVARLGLAACSSAHGGLS
jgi:hypothetical protein